MSHDDSRGRKARRYAFAQERLKKAIDAGFYLEAITLCESMLADRLHSSLARRTKQIVPRNKSFGWLIGAHESDPSLDKSSSTDGVKVNDIFGVMSAWKGERNELLHGFAKCFPGEAICEPAELMERAKDAAVEGQRLFRLLDNWHRKHTRNRDRPDGFDSAA